LCDCELGIAVVMSVALSEEQLAAIEMLSDEQLRERLLEADWKQSLVVKMDREALVRSVDKWTAMILNYEASVADRRRRYEQKMRELEARQRDVERSPEENNRNKW